MDDEIEKQCKEEHAFVKKPISVKYKESDEISVRVDLETLMCVSWLLDKITNGRVHNPSDLFNEAHNNYLAALESINREEE